MFEALSSLSKVELLFVCFIGYSLLRLLFSMVESSNKDKARKDETQVGEMKHTLDDLRQTVTILKENVSQFKDIISEIRQDLKALQGLAQKVQGLEDDLDQINDRMHKAT